jgi:DNA replication and repair protein RecF
LYLTHLSLTNFRNFARLDVDTPRGPILLVGDNAQGKTSLLEAVYYLATFMSFHASSDRQLINLDAEPEPMIFARIEAQFSRNAPGVPGARRSHRLEVRIILDDTGSNGNARVRKEVLFDDTRQKVGDALGLFNAVLFLPQMLRFIEGPPEERRRYLNLAMAQVVRQYGTTLNDYHQILTQRNALLKQLGERGVDLASAASQLAYWNDRLARAGAQIIHARIKAIKELDSLAGRYHHALTKAGEILRLVYQPSFDPLVEPGRQLMFSMNDARNRSVLSLQDIQGRYLERLSQNLAEELARGITTLGPHRDELRFLANQFDLGTYGSRGQARTAVLALKLAEVAWIREKTGEWPVLLLDEVLAELDPGRRADLLAHLAESEQVWMSTTDIEPFSQFFLDTTQVWQVKAGKIILEVEK